MRHELRQYLCASSVVVLLADAGTYVGSFVWYRARQVRRLGQKYVYLFCSMGRLLIIKPLTLFFVPCHLLSALAAHRPRLRRDRVLVRTPSARRSSGRPTES